jgi:hypothetical protein
MSKILYEMKIQEYITSKSFFSESNVIDSLHMKFLLTTPAYKSAKYSASSPPGPQ